MCIFPCSAFERRIWTWVLPWFYSTEFSPEHGQWGIPSESNTLVWMLHLMCGIATSEWDRKRIVGVPRLNSHNRMCNYNYKMALQSEWTMAATPAWKIHSRFILKNSSKLWNYFISFALWTRSKGNKAIESLDSWDFLQNWMRTPTNEMEWANSHKYRFALITYERNEKKRIEIGIIWSSHFLCEVHVWADTTILFVLMNTTFASTF